MDEDAKQNPTPAMIRQTRIGAGLTQKQAAELIHCGLRAWQEWEGEGPDETRGRRRMHGCTRRCGACF